MGASAFSPWLPAAAAGGTVWLGDTTVDSLTGFGSNGQRRLKTHLPFSRREPSASEIDAMRSEELATARDERSQSYTRAKYSGDRLPRYLPYFRALVPGLHGEVWVQEYAALRTEPTRYLVLGADGVPRAWITLPPGVRVSDVASDRLVGIHVDDDGVETIEVLRYTRK